MTAHYQVVSEIAVGPTLDLIDARRAGDDGGLRRCVLAYFAETADVGDETLERFARTAEGIDVTDFGRMDGRAFVAVDVPDDGFSEEALTALGRAFSVLVEDPEEHVPTIVSKVGQFSELMNVELLLDPPVKAPPPTAEIEVEPEDELLGAKVGPCRLERLVGEGSYGRVYLGMHETLDRRVAVKILRSTSLRRSAYDRFAREAAALSRIEHPNLVRLYEAGEYQGRPYVVMERIPGRTLRDVVRMQVLGPSRALHVARQIAAGLAAAHDAGCVHRDLKPLNVMVVDEHGLDHVKLLDFGLVRVLDGDTFTRITRTDMTLGTPRWMAPEQAMDPHRVDPRADLYALGLLMHYMLCGVRAVAGALPDVYAKRAEGPPDSIPEAGPLEPVIQLLLEPDPDRRPQTANELIERLDAIEPPEPTALSTAPVDVTWSEPTTKTPWSFVAAIGGLVVAAFTLAYVASAPDAIETPPPSPPIETTPTVAPAPAAPTVVTRDPPAPPKPPPAPTPTPPKKRTAVKKRAPKKAAVPAAPTADALTKRLSGVRRAMAANAASMERTRLVGLERRYLDLKQAVARPLSDAERIALAKKIDRLRADVGSP